MMERVLGFLPYREILKALALVLLYVYLMKTCRI